MFCQSNQNLANQSRPIKLGPFPLFPLITRSGTLLVCLLHMAVTSMLPKIDRVSSVYTCSITDDLSKVCTCYMQLFVLLLTN